MFACCLRGGGGYGAPEKSQKGNLSPENGIPSGQDAGNKLFFFEDCRYAFDLEDLLRACAEVLGKGTFGTSYKAGLEDTTTLVVKRLKEVGVGKREFEQQMEIIGRIKHENVAELKAYYYSKDEKLVVYDYYNQGSLSTMLHGNRGGNRTPLDWDARMRIAIGTAQGIAHIHTEKSGKLVHGNIASSNIFLNSQNHGCISEHGLTSIMSTQPKHISHAAGYRAPEVTDTRKSTQSSDVYSFGVVLLELLTGRSPVWRTARDEIINVVKWIRAVVEEEWTGEVFAPELLRNSDIEEEMVAMLQIAMSCVTSAPEDRPQMADVVKSLENVRQIDK